ncbi:MAG: hypothetical protein SNI70_06050 [Rikenellaceae bacterium]
MKNYNKVARVYPTILALIIPSLMWGYYLTTIANEYLQIFENDIFHKIMTFFVGLGLVTALQYALSTFVSIVAKIVFERIYWGKDNIEMPSNTLLLLSDPRLSEFKKMQIRKRISIVCKINMPDDRISKENRICVLTQLNDVMSYLRNGTRDSVVVFDKLCHYGFVRNFMGGLIIGVILVLALLGINIFYPFVSINYFIISLAILIAPIFFSRKMMMYTGVVYSKALFDAFLSKKTD